jgi:hypothetical protein
VLGQPGRSVLSRESEQVVEAVEETVEVGFEDPGERRLQLKGGRGQARLGPIEPGGKAQRRRSGPGSGRELLRARGAPLQGGDRSVKGDAAAHP